ncbi:MAG: hypothetical protein A2X49_12515 [Lentisphaerae bacterium GWF2_52_8]|nr:MAG: hypothetical protein A2X49_12515 [Lentisphaerae bacterium GWF2_52_8]
MRRHGFHTAAFGKVHLTPEQYTLNEFHEDIPNLDWRRFAQDAGIPPIPEDPCKENYGFETHLGCEDILQGEFKRWLKEKAPKLADRKPERLRADGPGDLFVSPYPSEFHQSTFIAEKSAEFIRAQKNSGTPWLTFCSFIAPHHPFEAPLDQIRRYDIDSIPLPSMKGGVEASLIPAPASDGIGEGKQYSDEVLRLIAHHYLASISLIDDGVGCLLAALEQSGQMDNTIIIFTSDHGEFLGNHGLLRKTSIHYDETLRVPLLIRFPGSAPRRVNGLVELTDLHPTLFGLLGLPMNDGVQGIDWSAKLKTGEIIGRDDIYSDMFDITPQRFGKLCGPYMAVQTLRTQDWKLNIYPTAGRQYGQLFDLKNDPDESRNLYADAEFKDIREELLWRLLSRVQANTDPLPFWLTQY